jgi:glutamate carboxypeptidase
VRPLVVVACAFAWIACTGVAVAAGLSAAERRMVASVDRQLPARLALLERTVEVNSGTMNLDGVREVGRMFAPEFERLGFRTRWVDGAPFRRAGHLVARRDGRAGATRVLLIGHLDTVFERDSPFQRFERLSDSTARGPGTTDMKGGIVVMLMALEALRDAGALDRLAFTVVLTGDEESVGDPIELARADLIEAGRWADVAIGFEDGAGDPRTPVISRRGSTTWRLRAEGRAYHSSQIFRDDVGYGAIYEAARILSAFRDSLAGEPLLTFNPGVMLGGTAVAFDTTESRGAAFGKANVVAESTVVQGDLRAGSLEQRERAKATMRRIVARHLPVTSAAITFDDGYPPMAATDGNRALLAIYDGASRDLGLGGVEPVDPMRAGAADVSFVAADVEMAIDGIGLMGEGGHTERETADLRTLAGQARRVAVTLDRLSRRRSGSSSSPSRVRAGP